jgi:hypothetical protein
MSMWWARVVNTIPGDCLASSAIRCSFVETESELDVSGIFPSNGSVSRRLLPSAGSLGSVPPLHQYYEALRLLSVRPGTLRSPSRPGTRRRLLGFAPRGGTAGKRPLGPVPLCGGPTRVFNGRRRGLPGSWGTLDSVPRSQTPARGDRLGRSAGGSCGLPGLRDRRPSLHPRFRGSITRPAASLSTLRRRGHPAPTQDSLPAGPT